MLSLSVVLKSVINDQIIIETRYFEIVMYNFKGAVVISIL